VRIPGARAAKYHPDHLDNRALLLVRCRAHCEFIIKRNKARDSRGKTDKSHLNHSGGAQHMPTCEEIFNEMPNRFDSEAAGDWEAKVQYKIEGDGGGNWIVTVSGGAATVATGEADDASATLETDAETWVGIAEGTVEPTTAFMTGKIRIQGNMADVMKSQSVFKKD
jgi:putative sterol carrier protein